MSLRKLAWMAGKRKETEGFLVAWEVSVILARMPFTGKVFDPRVINPFGAEQSAEIRAKIDDVKAFIAGRGFAFGRQ